MKKICLYLIIFSSFSTFCFGNFLLVEDNAKNQPQELQTAFIIPATDSEKDVNDWIQFQGAFVVGVSTWGFMNIGVQAGVELFDGVVAAGVGAEAGIKVGIAASLYLQLTPVPVELGKLIYLHGKAYRVFYATSLSEDYKPNYGLEGGVGVRLGQKDHKSLKKLDPDEIDWSKESIQFGLGRTLSNGFNCPEGFEDCTPDTVFHLSFLGSF